MITTLRIKKGYKDRLEVAVKWYSILSILNNFKWSPLEIKIIAYTAIEGNISSGGKKKKFCELFKVASGSVSNTLPELQRAFYLIKENNKVMLHPQLRMDFSFPILAQINLYEASN